MEKEPIHLFLDTTLTYEDPFFKKNYNRQLIRLSEIYGFPIFMSRVVFDETRNKYALNVKDRIGSLESALSNLENYYPSKLDTVKINCTLDDFILEFDKFYSDLIERKILNIIEYDNDLLPILVERSIKRIKPFSNNKQEFRDAITWLSYVKYADVNNLSNCFFITHNTSDFCDDKKKNTFHPELLNDSERFSHFITAYDILDIEPKLKPYIVSAEITEWITKIDINTDFIEEKFNDNFENKLVNAFTDTVERGFMDEFVETRAMYSEMDIRPDSASIARIHDEITFTIINDQVVVKGDVYVDIEVSIYHYDEYTRKSRNLGSDTVQMVATYTFTMDKNSIHEKSLELENFDVIRKASFDALFERDYDD